MNYKLFAMGNILMKDDGIAVYTAKKIEGQLHEMGIEVIYGETDPDYSISCVSGEEFLILLDAAFLGDPPGTVRVFALSDEFICMKGYYQHDLSFLKLCRLYYPEEEGVIITIEMMEIDYGYGLSPILEEKAEDIAEIVMNKIESICAAGRRNGGRNE